MARLGLALGACLCLAPAARASDSASVQISVAAPDPVLAGEAVSFQLLAVNTGAEVWITGSYYWEVEVFDLDRNFVAKLDRIAPAAAVNPGETTSAVFFFNVPDTLVGRRLFRGYLVHNDNRLVETDYRGFQILARAITPPKLPEYKFGGNLTLSYKNSSKNSWTDHTGATSLNLIGKMREDSYQFNAYLTHDKKKPFNPYILLFNYFAPWGTVSLGDIQPTFGTLSLGGQGMRGAMLAQNRRHGRWGSGFILAGGRTVAAQSGSLSTNGRYQRMLYSARAMVDTPWKLQVGANYVLGFDDQGSLSADSAASNYRGPTLRPQKNPSVGLDAKWEPGGGFKLLGELQKSSFFADATSTGAAVNDTAYRGEARLDRPMYGARAWVMRTGPHFSSFGSPTAIADRLTTEGSVALRPVPAANLFGTINQFEDNLSKQPGKVTTTQRVISTGGSYQFESRTGLNLSYSVNTAVGEPRSAQDNQTTTLGLGVNQPLGAQTFGVNVQKSAFQDKNKTAHDLDTLTLGLSSTLRWAQKYSGSLGVTTSDTKDKVDGSSRKSQSLTGSLGFPVRQKVSAQVWGTWTGSKSDSPTSPSETATLNLNAETTYQRSASLALTVGVGRNQTTSKKGTTPAFSENLVSLRLSHSF